MMFMANGQIFSNYFLERNSIVFKDVNYIEEAICGSLELLFLPFEDLF